MAGNQARNRDLAIAAHTSMVGIRQQHFLGNTSKRKCGDSV